jgi:ubiquinone/menaquinone biosynthesis C-methylase UbiE
MLKKLENLLQAEVDPAFAKRARFILETIAKEKPKIILDIGCGRGFYVHALSLYSFLEEINGIDIQKEYISQAKKNVHDRRVHLQVGNVYKLPYSSSSIDFIICSEVFEHLTDEKKALSEIKRVLKKRGSVVFTVPNENFPFFWDPINWFLMRGFKTHVNKDIWWAAGIWAGHERLYTKETLKNALQDQEMQIVTIRNYLTNCWPFSHFILYGIGKNLVERAKLTSFSRFRDEPSLAVKSVAGIFHMPSKFDKKNPEGSAVGLVAHLKKV